jgi:(1->4)-alpha-D-glucan 1-alpha-D-glucosylmutase
MLDRLSEKNRHYRDFTLDQLTAALRETIACFPVYRTYVEPERPIRDEDRLIILKALRRARYRNPAIDRPVFDFIRKVLLLELPAGLSEQEREEYVRFTLKFQQCSGPIMAKGLEDTTFYNFNRLIALNEVGGEPGSFGLAPQDFHARCASGCGGLPTRFWPRLLTTQNEAKTLARGSLQSPKWPSTGAAR